MKTISLGNPANKRICSLLIAMLFVIMLVISVATADDYGLPYDETVEIEILLMNVREMAETFMTADNQLSYVLDDRGVPAITESVEKDHGQSVYYPFAAYILKITNLCQDDISYSGVSNAYHRYTAAVCFTGVVALFFIALELTGNRALALFGALMLYLSPRFFGESHYNNKDIVLLCLLIDMSLFALRAIKRRKLSDALAFAVLAAFAANTKIVGIFFFGVLGLSYLAYVTINKQWNRRSIFMAVLTIFTFCLGYYVLTPAMWKSPIEFFQYSIDNAFLFSRHEGTVFFEGQVLVSALGQVPRYYLVKYIAITTPIFILLLTALGIVRLVKVLADKRTYSDGKWEMPFFVFALCFSALLPLIVSSISKSTVYNGWRHFYFSYFGVLVLAIYGLELIHSKYRKTTMLTMAALLTVYAVMIAANHPYEFSYFNVLAGSDAADSYETDYWGLSAADSLRLMLEDADDGADIRVSYLDTESGHRIMYGLVMLTQEEQSAFSITKDTDNADYIVENAGYQAINDSYDIPNGFYLFKTIDAFGNRLVNIYKRS